MPTNHYECTKCEKPCDWYNPATRAQKERGDTVADLSKCCNAPVVVRSGKDW